MKRVGNIFGAVVEPANLELAFWKASRGKRGRDDQRQYQANLDEELQRLREGLLDGSYPIGNYRRFVVCEPKERIICAAAFRERVLHHALMNVLEPHIERWLIFDSYACRKGKGQLRAVCRAQQFAQRYRWFMKCDIKKFFDSIPHEGLDEMLRRKLKDQYVIDWLQKIIATYDTTPGRGLPIGNLTSQHLANLYLDKIDRFCASSKVGYVRYMDDFVFWCNDKAVLLDLRRQLGVFIETQLGLSFKQEPFINRTIRGMDFLGMRVFPKTIRANQASLDRFKRKVRIYDWELNQGYWDEAIYQQRMGALTAFLQAADTLAWRKQFLRKEEGRRRETSGSNRVIRGGSWNNNAQNCRSANRNNNNPSNNNNNNNNGFRLCFTAAPQVNRENSAVPAVVPFPQGTKRSCLTAVSSAMVRESCGWKGRGFGTPEPPPVAEGVGLEGHPRTPPVAEGVVLEGHPRTPPVAEGVVLEGHPRTPPVAEGVVLGTPAGGVPLAGVRGRRAPVLSTTPILRTSTTEPGGHLVHRKATGAEACLVAFGKAREYEQAVGGEFARVFRRGVVAWRKCVWHHLNEAAARLGFEAAQQLLFARRNEARYHNVAISSLSHKLIDSRSVLGDGLLEREAHVAEKGRGEQRGIAHTIPMARGVERGVAQVGEAHETLGVTALPECACGVELDVVANGLELARVEGEFDVAGAAEEVGERGFGGVPPSFPAHLHGIHQPMSRPERAKVRVDGIVGNQQEVDVVGHNYEVADRRGWERAVKGDKRGLYQFAKGQQFGTMRFVNQLREDFATPAYYERYEKELKTSVMEVKFHNYNYSIKLVA